MTATLFLSYSSKDRPTARRLASDLVTRGYAVWLDEWHIHVGECIPTKIEEGIGTSDFLLVLLSQHAVESPWVDREWKAAYWNEVNGNSVAVLPVRLEPCKMPVLLQTKRYADFSASYDHGLRELIAAIDYYLTLKTDANFFRAIPTVWAEDRSLSAPEKLERNEYWDHFEARVRSLSGFEQRGVQIANSVDYLRKYGLAVAQLKAELKRLGLFSGPLDDVFTLDLAEAILSFQITYNLRHHDGVFGPLTYLAMAGVAREGNAGNA